MARSTRAVTAKPMGPARKGTILARSPAKRVAAEPVEAPPAKTMPRAGKSRQSAPAQARKAVASAPARALPTPKLSKDELKAQVEKLVRSVATLRTKNRDMARAAKAANGRITELEAEVTRLEGVVAQAQAAAKPAKRPIKRTTAAPAAKMPLEPNVVIGREVPADVKVESSPPLDETTETATNGLEESPSADS